MKTKQLHYWWCAILIRCIVPVVIGIATIIRPSLLSCLYMLFLLWIPFVPVPTKETMLGHSGIFLKAMIVISVITSVSTIAFQIVLASMPPYGSILVRCEFLELVLRHVGLIRMDDLIADQLVIWIIPEVIMLVCSIAFFLLFKKLIFARDEEEEEPDEFNIFEDHMKIRKKIFYFLTSMGRYAVLVVLCLAAVLVPSVQAGIYFIVFLSSATWWACYKQLGKSFAVVLCTLLPIVTANILVLYFYQFEYLQDKVSDDYRFARYFGLDILRESTCKDGQDPRFFQWHFAEWSHWANPVVLYWLYTLIILEAKALFNPELLGGVGSSNKRYGSGRKGDIIQDASGSVTITGHHEDIPLDDLGMEGDRYQPTFFEKLSYALDACLQGIIRVSYLGTNIIMMAWSITYLSWLTFVLLLWANLVWAVPNQRRAMLVSSPFLVAYAWFLLLSAYVYSMNLTEEELPSKMEGVNLQQIGFIRITENKCLPLIVKCLYTTMFWVTLRQYMQERVIKKQSSALADMVAPLQVTVGAATTGTPQKKPVKLSTMDIIGAHVRKFLTKFWIWIVAITLFGVAITGERMTLFRVVYMALFLIFVLTFQLSFHIWRKMMFVFWLIVILYSMLILIATYTYQFDNFHTYWRDYLYISEEQQLDIGLEQFQIKELFVRLVTPTFFVIITVIQLHYFHKDFMKLSDPKNTTIIQDSEDEDQEDMDRSSLQGGGAVEDSEKDDPTTTTTVEYNLKDVGILSLNMQKRAESFMKNMHKLTNYTFLFLEIHMAKVVLLFAMIICVYDENAIYFVIVLLITFGLICGTIAQSIAIYTSSIIVSIILLARMVYQIKYIQPRFWNVNCTFETPNNTEYVRIENNAHWLGFRKIENFDISLPTYVKWNIYYILVVTFWSVINIRQYYYKIARNRPTTRTFFMFPKITRSHADKNLRNMIKYLFNYGFYKFGVEISLMAMVLLIGVRMDMYSVFHALWLCAFCTASRKVLSKVWILYVLFTALSLPFQYFMVIGLPPQLCMVYPYDKSEVLIRLHNWAYLMDQQYKLPAKKLLFDFILLLTISRQWVVFRIEKRYAGKNYAGGSNDPIIHLYEDPNFENPVPDYITYLRSYLDICKRMILMSFLWISLALMFLAGTNRVNIFSIGHLIGAFFFLWEGTDMYLRPIPKIVKRWNYLIAYCVVSIFVKTVLQFVGCVLIRMIPLSACWVVKLWGIGCVRKFGNIVVDAGLSDEDICTVRSEYIGVAWDGLCLIFLIIQRKIFCSYNFFHMINETKATTILASRGADLMEELRKKRIKETNMQEQTILEKIKLKMEKIKASQLKIEGAEKKSKKSHVIDSIFSGRPKYRRRQPKTYKEAIRSGDYYMFDELEDDDIDLVPDVKPDEEELLDENPDFPTVDGKTVSIKEEQEPHPGTSHDEDLSSDSDDERAAAPKVPFGQKVRQWLIFIWALIESVMTSLTHFLNRYTKDYRYLVSTLKKEKKFLKENTNYTEGVRVGSGKMWKPGTSYDTLIKQAGKSDTSIISAYEEEEMSQYDQPVIVRMLLSIWYIVTSRSEILCYLVVFIYQMRSASFISLPLPILALFWGSLTIPRPTKTFWVTLVAYIEVVVLVKCIFQFEIMPWHDLENYVFHAYFPAKVIGIQKQEYYANWDLVLLLVIFFHRYLLKSIGIWTHSMNRVAALLQDGEYRVEGGRFVPVNSDSQQSSKDEPSTSERTAPSTIKSKESVQTVKDAKRSKSSSGAEDPILSIRSVEIDPCDHFPQNLAFAGQKYAEAFRIFTQELLDPTSRVAADVYTYMFLCDFVNFIVLLLGFSSFGVQQDSRSIDLYLKENKVPVMFLLMLVVQFILIIIDRGIYLRKNILAKLIFQFVQVIVLHVWLFILYPIITEKEFTKVFPPQMYYFMKCCYFIISAYQIRCGYPTRILGNFCCKDYTIVNNFMFKGYMVVPFLFELRTLMDWMWTDTSLTVMDWLKMEDIYAHIFKIKCERTLEEQYPQIRGKKKNPKVKYLVGGFLLIIIIGIIWFPLVFFSLQGAVGEAHTPTSFHVKLRLGPYEPIYEMNIQETNMHPLTDREFTDMQMAYNYLKEAEDFLANYEPHDVVAIDLPQESANIWIISPPDKKSMVEELGADNELEVSFEYKLTYEDGTVNSRTALQMKPNDPERLNILHMLNGVSEKAVLPYFMPKFFKIAMGQISVVPGLLERSSKHGKEEEGSLRHVTLELFSSNETGAWQYWWKMAEDCTDKNYEHFLNLLPHDNCKTRITLYTFNEKVFPETLSFLTGGGIIGAYTTIVLVAARILRGFFGDQCFKIMFDDLPNVDRVMQLCLNVYLVREMREYALEEDLFAKLVFLFRSPETMIKWTRPKEELEEAGEEEDEEGED